MVKFGPYLLGLSLMVTVLLIVGCQGPGQRADIQQIPQITKLVEQATAAPRAHRFRRPLRDKQARILRELAVECERMADDARGERVSAQALAGQTTEPATAGAGAGPLESALSNLAAAARRGDLAGIRSSHAAVLTAYTRDQSRDPAAVP